MEQRDMKLIDYMGFVCVVVTVLVALPYALVLGVIEVGELVSSWGMPWPGLYLLYLATGFVLALDKLRYPSNTSPMPATTPLGVACTTIALYIIMMMVAILWPAAISIGKAIDKEEGAPR